MSSSVRFVATLIAAEARALPDATIALGKQAVRAIGATSVVEKPLEEGVASDLFFAGDVQIAASAAVALHDALGSKRVDAIVQPAGFRRKKLLLADMDSTMIGQECIDELADIVGLKGQVSSITERAMRGEIEFEPALRKRVALLRGLEDSIVGRIVEERITLTPGGRALVRTMRANRAYTALVSGGFTAFSSRIAEMIGFDEHRANLLLVESGRFVGRVAEPILGKTAKLAALVELRGRLGLSKAETLAIGDGANDLAMLTEAGLGVAFHAKAVVAAAAHARIEHCDLTALLYAQGYRRCDFVGA